MKGKFGAGTRRSLRDRKQTRSLSGPYGRDRSNISQIWPLKQARPLVLSLSKMPTEQPVTTLAEEAAIFPKDC